ncbi:efflux RND transporter periplasmic adaptor subunit [Gayadomonas joobiniege]|uniref:efflux RND transporter periplasmic adaptor subunit n=1 Tax=Gayadomonas joobiniege TaxID=1234606 RepID=UPI000372345C|nr:efflux RND transporter periplasmic adaptor subunit [Gayadomonas joobiniege]
MNTIFRTILFLGGLFWMSTLLADEHQPSDEKEADAEHEIAHKNEIFLETSRLEAAGIKVETLSAKKHFYSLYAPGEVKANGYKSYLVAPRVDSIVVDRKSSLGDIVQAGDPVVTLFSEAMSLAQAEFLVASSNWERAKKLAAGTVSESQLVEIRSQYQAAYGKLIALGLTTDAIQKIPKQADSSFGQYDLVAPSDGIVLQDEFIQGQQINAGETLILIADENELWVEANISPDLPVSLSRDSMATIELNGLKLPADIIQQAHTVNPVTRTRVVRLLVKNNSHKLHSGMFVTVSFQLKLKNKVIAVPEDALIRDPDGDWMVFVESEANRFRPVEVTRGRPVANLREIFGISEGTKVVTAGAFFIASEINKGGFDPHNH